MSAYHFFSNGPLASGLWWKAARMVLGGRKIAHADHEVFERVGHENGITLYTSPQAPHVLKSRRYEWYVLSTFLFWSSGFNTLAVLPFMWLIMSLPRRVSELAHFTFHAELLPHTEQVVFHKAGNFGELYRVVVDINNLEKIDADALGTPLIWEVTHHDPYMCFRDAESNQMFAFDKNGVWN